MKTLLLANRNKWIYKAFSLFICLALFLSVAAWSITGTVQADDGGDSFNSYIIDTFDESGDDVDLILVPGSPPESSVPKVNLGNFGTSGSTILPSVPAFNWCYGCSATSAAMLFGYYDNQGYDNMYDGPANDGVCPLTNLIWGSGECPLSATHEGYDGLEDKGHVDDYWASSGSNNDPYYDNWDEHGYEDCTADFMGTNQYHNWNTSDGGTFFFFRGDGSPLYDYDICEPSFRDGSHGMRLFAESRGYTVDTNFSQYIEGLGSNPDNGFSFSDFQEEIDSGRPVIIQVAGHSMLGFGYSDPDTIFIHNTWDYNDHSMTWGGSYCGMQHYGVTVLRLEEAPEPPEPEPELSTVSTESADSVEQNSATLNGILDNDGGESCQFRFEYDIDSAEPYDFNTGWTGSFSTGEDFNDTISGLEPDTTYYFRAQTKNSAGSSSGAELSFTSSPVDLIPPEAPASFSAAASGSQQIDLSWTIATGANQTKVQRKQGGFPSDKDDGIEVYFSNSDSFSDTSLSPETTYYYRAWSFSQESQLWSIDGAEAQATTEKAINIPSVSTLSAGSVEQNSATLNGMLDNDGGESCQFRFEYDIDSAEPYDFNTGWTGSLSAGEYFNNTILGLEPDTTYYFHAQTKNSAGSSSGAEFSFTSLSAALIPPEAPASFFAVASGSEQIDLSWTRATGANQTKVQRKQSGFPSDKDDGVEIYFSNGDSFSDTGLSSQTTYYYRAWSFSEDGEQWSANNAEAQATTEPLANNPPDKPTDPSPESQCRNVSIEVTLSWTGGDPDSGDTVVYDVYLDAVDASTLVAANQSSTTFNSGGLQNDVTYYWKIIATDGDRESTASPVWEFTTEPVEKIPVSYNISLSTGWNLISLPIIPDNNNITRIITPDNLASGDISNINIIYSFNISGSKWIFWNGSPSSTITSIKDGQGYWLFAEAEDTLTIWGTEATVTDYSMTETWNMLGFTSIAEQDYASYLSSIGGSYSMLYGWDAATESWFCPTLNQHGGKLEPGRGYWIYMSSPATIMLS